MDEKNGRLELNLVEFPLTGLSDKALPGVKTLEFEDEIFDASTQLKLARKLTVTASDKWGLPRAFDDDVLIGLVQISRLFNGFSAPVVEFSRFEIIQTLGLKDQGAYYRRIDESIERWSGVLYVYKSSWRDIGEGVWETRGFHMIDNFVLVDEATRAQRRAKQLKAARSWFKWNDVIFKSFQDGYLRTLDLDLYFRKLTRPVTRRVFRYLLKHFNQRPVITKNLRVFAFDKIGLSRNYDTGEIKFILDKTFRELEEVGFLEKTPPKQRYTKVTRGDWEVTVRKASGVKESASKPKESWGSVQAYWDSLDEATRGLIQQQAIEEAGEELMATLASLPSERWRESAIRRCREEYVARMIGLNP